MIWRRWRQLLTGVAALLPLAVGPFVGVTLAVPAEPGRIRQAQAVEVEIGPDVFVNRPVDIVIRAPNPAGEAGQGSLTVSLPGNPTVEIVGSSAAGAKVFRPGDQMFSFTAGRNVAAQVVAVELFLSSWPVGGRQELKLRVTSGVPYTLLARASVKRADGKFVHLPTNGPPDQQGAPTRRIDVTPKAPGVPTVTPAPPTPVPPSPTAPAAPTTRVALVPVDAKPAAQKPGAQKPATGPSPTTGVPAAPVLGPSGTSTTGPGPTSASTTVAAAAPVQPEQPRVQGSRGPSLPLLLAGFGIMLVGVATGLIALVLWQQRRRQPSAPPAPAWTGVPGQYLGQGQSLPGPPPYGAPPSGVVPPWEVGVAGAGDAGGRLPTRDLGHAPGRQAAPWDRPSDGPAPTFGTPPSSFAGPLPTTGAAATGSGAPDELETPRPTSVTGMGGLVGATPTSERYTERTLTGRGGMGSVYRAYDTRLRRWVALKIMHADLGLQPGFVDRFIREAQMAAMLEHPNIVTVYDVEPVGASIQMVMAWIDGEDLQHVLEREGALAPVRAAYFLDQTAAALDHAHLRERPILHRDIKPSNIMIGPSDRAILTDFGIARLIGDVSLTQTGQMVGTPAYMAPEMVQGGEADARADIYALGVVVYQMLTGRAPFRAETPLAILHAHVNTPPTAPRTIVPSLPPEVDRVLLQALAKDPAARFQTAGALARALRAALGRS